MGFYEKEYLAAWPMAPSTTQPSGNRQVWSSLEMWAPWGNVTSVSSRDGHNQLAEVSQRIAVKEIIGWLIDSRLVGEGTATLLKRDIYLYYWLLLEYLSIVRMPLEQPV